MCCIGVTEVVTMLMEDSHLGLIILYKHYFYRLCCVVVCDLETSRMGAPYIYDISRLRVKCKYDFMFVLPSLELHLSSAACVFLLLCLVLL